MKILLTELFYHMGRIKSILFCEKFLKRRNIHTSNCSVTEKMTAEEMAAICEALEVPYDYFYRLADDQSV